MTHPHFQRAEYADVREHMQPGDIIAFGGNSLFSKWAKLTTRSRVTHVAVVLKTQILDQQSDRYFNQVIEATSYNNQSGVMVNRISDRLASYDGDMWWLPLHPEKRSALEAKKDDFFDFLFAQKDMNYDIWQLFGSAVDFTDDLPLLKKLSHNSPDFSSWFCSELVAAALEVANVVTNVNASEVTPIDLCRFDIFDNRYVQLKGEDTPITGFNSLPPDGWGQQ